MKQSRNRLGLAGLIASLTINSCPGLTRAQTVDALAPQVLKFLKVSTPKAVLEHVQIIDGQSRYEGQKSFSFGESVFEVGTKPRSGV